LEFVEGTVIENRRVNNIVAENTGNALFIRFGHSDDEKPWCIKNIHISNVKVQVPFGRPDIDYDFRGPEVDFLPAFVFDDVHTIQMKNVKLTGAGEQPHYSLSRDFNHPDIIWANSVRVSLNV
jgi:hypothetical protein